MEVVHFIHFTPAKSFPASALFTMFNYYGASFSDLFNSYMLSRPLRIVKITMEELHIIKLLSLLRWAQFDSVQLYCVAMLSTHPTITQVLKCQCVYTHSKTRAYAWDLLELHQV